MTTTTDQTEPESEYEHYFIYLDQLQESGITNMFGARPYLQRRYGLDQHKAHTVLKAWMESYDQRHPTEDKA